MLRPLLLALFAATVPALADPGGSFFTLRKNGLPARIDDSPALTTVGACFSPGDPSPQVTLRIDWLNQSPPPADFTINIDEARNIHRSTHRLGDTHITRTILSSDGVIFLHFLADKPGDLSFRASLLPPEKTGVIVENRRELAWTAPGPAVRKVRAWIIPFESDVESDGSAIVLRGEGECLVILDFTSSDDPAAPISKTWDRIAAARDPGENPPDPVKIWHAILAEAAAR